MIRLIAQEDNAAVAQIIRTVMAEYGAVGAGHSINDPEVNDMFQAYAAPGSAYFVVVDEGTVVGGGGIGPLSGADEKVCELRKMYMYAGARGKGMGHRLLVTCLDAARELGYRVCYLETSTRMTAAARLYVQHQFTRLNHPMGATGHSGADAWYARILGGLPLDG